MTVDQLEKLKNKEPFETFTIHMADGHSFRIDDPESLVLRRDWSTDVLVLHPRGRFSFVYLKNVTHVTGEGKLPKLGGRRGRRNGRGES
jgi:hypothetical protein